MHVFLLLCLALVSPCISRLPDCTWPGRNFSGEPDDFEDLGTVCPTTFGGGAVSMSFYLRADSGVFSRAIDWGVAGHAYNLGVMVEESGASLRFQSNELGIVDVTGSLFALGRTQHYLWTLTEAGIGSLYVNGNYVGGSEVTWPLSRRERILYVAKSHWHADANFQGEIAQLRFWDGVALSCEDEGICTRTTSTSSTLSTSSTTLTTSATSMSSTTISSTTTAVTTAVTTAAAASSQEPGTSVGVASTPDAAMTSVADGETTTQRADSLVASSDPAVDTSPTAVVTSTAAVESAFLTSAATTPWPDLSSLGAAPVFSTPHTSLLTSIVAATHAVPSSSTRASDEAHTSLLTSMVAATHAVPSSSTRGSAEAATIPQDWTTPYLRGAVISTWAATSAMQLASSSKTSSEPGAMVTTSQQVAVTTTPSTFKASGTSWVEAMTSPEEAMTTTPSTFKASGTSWVEEMTSPEEAMTMAPSTSISSAASQGGSNLSSALLLHEQEALRDLGVTSKVLRNLPGVTVAAFALSSDAPATLSVAGWDINVPAAAVQGSHQSVTAFTAAIPDMENVGQVSKEFSSAAVANLNIHRDGKKLKVDGLADPIKVSVPVPESSKVSSVVYWDEEAKQWLGEGIELLERGNGTVRFSTTHLTLFAMVLGEVKAPFVLAKSQGANGLNDALGQYERDTLKELREKYSVLSQFPGLTVAAFAIGPGTNTFTAASWTIEVPESAVQDENGTQVVTSLVTAIPAVETVKDVTPEFTPMAVASLNFYSDQTRVAVKDLVEPIIVTVPVWDSSQLKSMVYWDTAELQWLERGISILEKGQGTVRFSTAHLTLFAAVWQGFLSTLACAQLGLLSLEGLEALGSGDWALGAVALCFWGMLLSFFLLTLLAWRLDASGRETLKDSVFLVPQQPLQGSVQGAVAGGTVAGGTAMAMVVKTSSAADFVPSSAARDALDEICSNWMECFGEVRDLLESVCSEISCESLSLTHLGVMAGRAVASLVAESARRQTCSSLGLSDECVSFVLEDEDLGELLLRAALCSTRENTPPCFKAWLEMHKRVLEGVDSHWMRPTDLRSLIRLMGNAQPVLAALKQCPLCPRSTRLLLLLCDLLGQLALAALFYEGSGMALNKKASRQCEGGEDLGFWGLLGRILAIVLVSALLANLPVMVLSSLSSRSCKKVPYEGSPQWHHQLRVWALRDRILWALATLYCSVCAFFLLLFLANIASQDLESYGITALMQLAQQLLIIPLASSIAVPIFTTTSLCILSRVQHKSPASILAEQRLSKEGEGNWKQLVLEI